MPIYSIPMEVHIHADTPEGALATAWFMPKSVGDNDTGTLHPLVVAEHIADLDDDAVRASHVRCIEED